MYGPVLPLEKWTQSGSCNSYEIMHISFTCHFFRTIQVFNYSLLYSQHGMSTLLQVIRGRCQPRVISSEIGDAAQGPSGPSMPFLLKQLQEDIIRTFFAGKPLIDTPTSLKMPFRFRQIHKPTDMDE